MNAVISGRAALAVLDEGGSLFSIHYQDLDEKIERRAEEWNLLFGNAVDLEYLEDCEEAEVRDRLEDRVDQTEALDLILNLLDGNLSDDVRESASLELNELLAYPEILESIESVLFACPLPDSADITGAIRSCTKGVQRSLKLVENVVEKQDSIRIVRHAFEVSRLNNVENADDAEIAMVQSGAFAKFVSAGLESASRVSREAILQQFKGPLQPHHLEALLDHWIKTIAEITEPAPSASSMESSIRLSDLDDRSKETSFEDHSKEPELPQPKVPDSQKERKPRLRKSPLKYDVVISYSHSDKKWLERIAVHLRPLEHQTRMVIWDDSHLVPGSPWMKGVIGSMQSARIVILVISADYLASDFFSSNAVPSALEAAERRGTVVLPLIVGPSQFASIRSLSPFQAVNDPSRPLSSLSRQESERALVRLAREVDRNTRPFKLRRGRGEHR